MKNAKVFFALSLCTALFLLASCKSATPLQRDGIVDIPLTLSNYEVLGRVKMVDSDFRIVFFSFGKAKKYGLYYKILEEAQKEYPTANDVVNVTVDFEGTSFLIFQKGTYTTTALAVRYK